jgi:hypothetical protein
MEHFITEVSKMQTRKDVSGEQSMETKENAFDESGLPGLWSAI